jgi:hypothetical protein
MVRHEESLIESPRRGFRRLLAEMFETLASKSFLNSQPMPAHWLQLSDPSPEHIVGDRMIARSMKFCNSRMLRDEWYLDNVATVPNPQKLRLRFNVS